MLSVEPDLSAKTAPNASASRGAIFLTGADEGYSRALYQLLRSARRHGYHSGHRWIAYDFGMDAATRQSLEETFPWCEFRTFDFAAYPAHVSIGGGSYAWKPIIIWDAVKDARGPVFWFDSANLIRGDLAPMFQSIERTGFYTVMGQSSLQERCDARVLEKLGVPRRAYGTRERCGGLIGVDASRDFVRRVVREWRDHALDEETIRPAVDRMIWHVNDQAVWSCLLLTAAHRGEIELGGEDIDISSPRPIRFMSTRNKVPTSMPRWADPAVRAWYRAWKAVDQLGHRLDRGRGPDQMLMKWRNEDYAVLYRGADGIERRVPCPFGRYYADPFVWQHEGRFWILVEDYSYRRLRGTIAAIPLDERLDPGRAVTILDPGSHASFPYLFAHEGRTYMVPENGKGGGVDLYECEAFPTKWTKRRRLIGGADAADSCVFRRDGRWWLVTSLTSQRPGGSYRYLAVFHAQDLLDGTWVPHPINEEALHIGAPSGTGRNAGAIVEQDGRLFRPMQNSRRHYAEGMTMMEIVELTPERYREIPADPPYPFADIVGRPNVHHVSAAGPVTAWDVRTRVG